MRRAPVLAVAALLLSLQSIHAASVPTVAVVKGDLLDGAGPETADLCEQRYRAVRDALKAGGIPYKESTDSTVERWGLPDVPVAILPCSPKITDDELYHLRAFLDRPARLIVFYPSRAELSRDVGAALGEVSREMFPGQFHSLHRLDASLTGLPASLTLDARIIRELTPADGRAVCSWHTVTGADAGVDGAIVSDRGALIGAPPAPERVPQLKLLLRALIGHFAPQMWTALAPRDPRRIGPVGHHASLSEFNSALRNASGGHLTRARGDVRRALELLASIPDLLSEGRQDEAIDASRRARDLAHRGWFRSYPSPSPEMRGVWASDTVDGGWDDAVRKLAEANFNVVFPYMASGAAAYYPSRILPITDRCEGNPLAEALAAGRAHDLAIHPRILGLFTMGASADVKQKLKQQGRLAESPSGPDSRWLCPSNHENRAQIVQTAVEMVSTYGAPGVQFDYLRYSWKDRCVCERCRARFETDTGVKVKNWPRDVLEGNLNDRFLQWRREMITSLLRTVRRKVKEADPEAVISAAVFINWEGHRDSFGQDWKRWIDEGLVDFVCPMTYIPEMDEFQGWVRKQEKWSGGNVPVAMGIGPFADVKPKLDPQGVLDQIQASRRLGCEGFVIFNYQRALAERYLPLLALGATSTPAEIPTEAR